jgi:hypothetical protein
MNKIIDNNTLTYVEISNQRTLKHEKENKFKRKHDITNHINGSSLKLA